MSDDGYQFVINEKYKTEEFVNQFRETYESACSAPFSKDGCQLYKLPFPCAAFEKFLLSFPGAADTESSSKALISAVESEARQLPFQRNCNDLYTFNQSVDIANFESKSSVSNQPEAVPLLSKLRRFLLSDILLWLEQLTGACLERDRVDFTSSIYYPNDVLLCHDDELDTRRVAFIWYLVPEDWDEQREGGTLDLFSCYQPEEIEAHTSPPIGTGPATPVYPVRIATSNAPRRNMFAFFEPSAYSFHQVSEIIGSRERLSLHGWFHGPPLPRPSERPNSPSIPRVFAMHIEEEMVYRWVNPLYLDMHQQAKIRRRFVKTSEIQLTNFLKSEQWSLVCRALCSLADSSWLSRGPYNKRHFDILPGVNSPTADAIPDVLRELYRLLCSEAMLVIVSDLTGVKLHPAALKVANDDEQDSEPPVAKRPNLSNGHTLSTSSDSQSPPSSCQLTDPQFRRWSAGSYTLLGDWDYVDVNWRLEAVLHLGGYGHRLGSSDDKHAVAAKSQATQTHWQTHWGGQLVYVAKDEKDELLTVQPVDNALTLVYTGPGTASFVKYVNHSAKFSWSHPHSSSDVNAGSENSATLSAFDVSTTFHEPNPNVESENDSSVDGTHGDSSLSGECVSDDSDPEDDYESE